MRISYKQPYVPPCVVQTESVLLEKDLLVGSVTTLYLIEIEGQEIQEFFEVVEGADDNTFNTNWD